MKKGTLITLIALAFGAGALAYEYDPTCLGLYEDEAPAKAGKAARKGRKSKTKAEAPKEIPGSYIGKNLTGKDWADTAALTTRLAAEIQSTLKGTDMASVKAFMAEPQNRLLLAQWFVAAADVAAAAEPQKEAPRDAAKPEEKPAPRTMAEVLASSPGAEKLLEQVTNNLDWMEQIAYSGECRRPGRAMAILAAVAEKEKHLAHKKMERDIATATAVEWAKSNWKFEKALARAEFYITNWQDDRLHTEFDDIPFWMRRMICGSKGDNAYGEVASLQWQLDNVNLPTERYAGCCWQCSYLRDNLFGDSIHGPMYYNPYVPTYGDNAAQRTYDVGGVCGSLSHYGAFAAIANGIPAMTAGEPGHCAYIVYSNNKWTPGYSLSWKRGLHWQVWQGIHKYASLHMATELFSAEQAEATSLSNALRTLGKLYASAGNKEKALASYSAAVARQPRNYGAWVDYAGFLKEQMPQDTAAWKQLNTAACTTLAPLYPEMAAELMKGHVYPGLAGLTLPAAEAMACLGVFWDAVEEMGPDRWDIEALCGAQVNVLKELGGKPEDNGLQLYEMVLGRCSAKPVYAPVILSWGNGLATGMKPEMQQKFLKATLTGLSKGGDMEADARDKMLGQALAGAAKMRDRSSFQAIGKMLSEKYRKNILPKWEPFPGKLVSQGGLLYTSSSAHDDPTSHWGVLEPTGGRFHTNNEENPWAVVEMPKTAYITGVVAISTSGQNVRRLHDMKVQYSESGRDDDWHEAGAFPAPSARVINRLDLQESKPRARFIRIIRGGGKDFFHLNAILVYGEQAA